MICPKCRTANADTASVCLKCGSRIGAEGGRATGSDTLVFQLAKTVVNVAFDDVANETLAEGVVLAQRYEILRLIGQGGMGAVYKAHDRELQRDVALKTIRAELASQRQILERFKREVSVTSRITHRNIVRVYDLGTEGRLRFLTMEFVEGQSLDAVIGPHG